MRQPRSYWVSGMFIVYCWCAAFLSAGKQSNRSVTETMSGHLAAAELPTLKTVAAANPTDGRLTLLRHADVSRNLGDYSAAEKIVKELVDSLENSLDADGPEVAIGLAKLGLLCTEQDKVGAARVYYQRALAIIDNGRAVAPSADFTLSTVQASVAAGQDLYPESEVVYQRLLSFLAHRAGHEEPIVAIILRDIAEIYRRQGKFDDAATYYDYALAILSTTLGADHPEYRFTNESYDSMKREQERITLKNP